MLTRKTIRIALASLEHPKTTSQCIEKVEAALKYAAAKGSRIICFPECYCPGLRGCGDSKPFWLHPDRKAQEHILKTFCGMARTYGIAVIMGMEWSTAKGLLNLAYVISAQGRIVGYQAKNQITPDGESRNYVPDGKRRIFNLEGIKFGIVICHEGWRYPETVRWAACRGAQIVFQPQVTGSDKKGKRRKNWGESFYEKAMICRTQENSIYFASVNTSMRFQNSATSLIAPTGKFKAKCMAYVPYGKEKVLVCNIDLSKATRLFAKRYNPKWYPE